jgi:hypothetical protein
VLEVGTDRFTVPEQLFVPSPELLDLKGDFDGYTFDGLDGMVRRSIEGCDVDIRKELYGTYHLPLQLSSMTMAVGDQYNGWLQ